MECITNRDSLSLIYVDNRPNCIGTGYTGGHPTSKLKLAPSILVIELRRDEVQEANCTLPVAVRCTGKILGIQLLNDSVCQRELRPVRSYWCLRGCKSVRIKAIPRDAHSGLEGVELTSNTLPVIWIQCNSEGDPVIHHLRTKSRKGRRNSSPQRLSVDV